MKKILIIIMVCFGAISYSQKAQAPLVFNTTAELTSFVPDNEAKMSPIAYNRELQAIYKYDTLANQYVLAEGCTSVASSAPTVTDYKAAGCIWVDTSSNTAYISVEQGSAGGNTTLSNSGTATDTFAINTTKRWQTVSLPASTVISFSLYGYVNVTGLYDIAFENNSGTALYSTTVNLTSGTTGWKQIVLGTPQVITAGTYRISIIRNTGNSSGLFSWLGFTPGNYAGGAFSFPANMDDAQFRVIYTGSATNNVWQVIGSGGGGATNFTWANSNNTPNSDTTASIHRRGPVKVNVGTDYRADTGSAMYLLDDNGNDSLLNMESTNSATVAIKMKNNVFSNKLGLSSTNFYITNSLGESVFTISKDALASSFSLQSTGEVRLPNTAISVPSTIPNNFMYLDASSNLKRSAGGYLPKRFTYQASVTAETVTNTTFIPKFHNIRLASGAGTNTFFLGDPAMHTIGDQYVVHAMKSGTDSVNVRSGNNLSNGSGMANSRAQYNSGTERLVQLEDGDVMYVSYNGSRWLYHVVRGDAWNNKNLWKVGGNTFSTGSNPTIGPTGTRPMHFQTNGQRRFSIASSGIGLNNSANKIMVLGLNDSLSFMNLIPVSLGGTGLSSLGTANQLLRVNAGATGLEYFTPAYITGNQTITLSGDVSGSGTTAITTTLANTSVTPGSYSNATVTFDSKGRATAASSGPTITASDWSGTVTITSSNDTLLNSGIGYGHFTRIGSIVNFTLRVEIALGSSGAANSIYIDPPIASNFSTAQSDVIGTATLDIQGASSANTPRQRALLFAEDGNNRIGIAFDPVGSLTYPANRQYISVSGSYRIQ